jgi:hypothetical protein
MARGWESKSIESQIEAADAERQMLRRKQLASAQIELQRKKESLLLSRTRVMHEIESAQNEGYKTILQKALADLDAKLAQL